jgi:hypothetical protein
MLVTPEEAASFIGGEANAQDPTLVRLTAAVCSAVQKSCGRFFEYAERTDYVRGFGLDYVFLTDAPIAEIVEVRIDPTGLFAGGTVPIDQFFFRPGEDDRRLWWRNGKFPEADIVARVTRRAGYQVTGDTQPQLPADIKTVILDEIAARIQRGSAEVMKSETIGSYSYTRFDGAFNPQNLAWLRPYRL